MFLEMKSARQTIFGQLLRLAIHNPATLMQWLPIVFVLMIVLTMIILGYYLIRNFVREYTYDVPGTSQSKTQTS